MIPFRERNPVIVGAVSIAVLALLMLAAFRAQSLPVIGGGDVYYASFTEAGGLKANDPVRLAGVRVGAVESIELADGEVKVGFRIETDARLGDETGADIKVATMLGQMSIMLTPAGDGELEEESTIPSSRTSSPFNVVDAFTGLAETSADINTDQLAEALTTLADLTRNTPEEFRTALSGVSRLSRNIAARDEEINRLLKSVSRVSKVLQERDDEIIVLMRDADVLFRALLTRRDAVHRLLVSTSVLSKELTTLVRQTRGDLGPALDHLENVVAVLNKNRDNIDAIIRNYEVYMRVFTNALGTGPWWDTNIPNIPPAGLDAQKLQLCTLLGTCP